MKAINLAITMIFIFLFKIELIQMEEIDNSED